MRLGALTGLMSIVVVVALVVLASGLVGASSGPGLVSATTTTIPGIQPPRYDGGFSFLVAVVGPAPIPTASSGEIKPNRIADSFTPCRRGCGSPTEVHPDDCVSGLPQRTVRWPFHR